MGIELRPYQREIVDGALFHLRAGRSVMAQAPTGAGKTVIGAVAASEYLAQTGGALHWLTHRQELAEQSEQSLGSAFARLHVWSSPVRLRNQLAKSLMFAGKGDLLVADEAHHASADTWLMCIEFFRHSGAGVLGLSATPWRMSAREGLNDVFEALVRGPQVRELVRDGYLAPLTVKCLRGRGIVGEGETAGGEFSEAATMRANDSRILIESGVDAYLEYCAGKRAVAYCVGVEHARAVWGYARSQGIAAELVLGGVSAKDKRERDEAVARFKSGNADMLVNCQVLTEGFDVPAAEVALILRPTKSLSLWLQMCGRVSRLKGLDESGRQRGGLVLDAGLIKTGRRGLRFNAEVHGLPDSYRRWSLNPRGGGKGGDPPPGVCCPACGEMNAAAAHWCQSCGMSLGKNCLRCGWVKHEWWDEYGCRVCRPADVDLDDPDIGMCEFAGCDEKTGIQQYGMWAGFHFRFCFDHREEVASMEKAARRG